MNLSADWLPYLQALGPAFAASATLFVGIMVFTVSRRQWRTAHEKLLVDLFDRRIAIYTLLENKASEFISNNGPTETTALEPELSAKIRFLFNEHVQKEVREFEDAMLRWKRIPPEVQLYDDEKDRLEVMKERNRKSVNHAKTFKKAMPTIFGPFLKLNQTGFKRR